jgi:hypothetical protein
VQFVGLVQLVGMRKRWDDRIREGYIIERFDRFTYSFYSVSPTSRATHPLPAQPDLVPHRLTPLGGYNCCKCMAGFGWIVSPRDIVVSLLAAASCAPRSSTCPTLTCSSSFLNRQGVNRNVFPTRPGGELLIVQTSVVDNERGPEQSGRVRATLGLSGWRSR